MKTRDGAGFATTTQWPRQKWGALQKALSHLRINPPGVQVRIPLASDKPPIATQKVAHEYASRHGVKIETATESGWLYMRRLTKEAPISLQADRRAEKRARELSAQRVEVLAGE